jgi:hypothetical protein
MMNLDHIRPFCLHPITREARDGRWVGKNGKHFPLVQCIFCLKVMKG